MTETLRSEIEIAAPQATVFAFLTDPDKILRWMGTNAQIEPYPGGIYLLSMNDTHTARGQNTQMIPVHRLAYSFGWERSAKYTPRVDLDRDRSYRERWGHAGTPHPWWTAGRKGTRQPRNGLKSLFAQAGGSRSRWRPGT